MVSETKLNDSFPKGQFLIEGTHSPYRFDRKRSGRGIMLYLWEDTPAKLLSHDFPSMQSFFIEINLYKKKSFINCFYNPHKSNIGKHLDIISRSLDTLSTKYNILHYLMILMHVLMMRLYRVFVNLTLCIVSLNNLHSLKIPRTLVTLI